MKKQLIINADDYGMSLGIVDGIIQCVQAGIVTSTSMMTTGEAFTYGIARLPGILTASIGVHLNVTSGKPLSPAEQIPSLLDSSGRFITRNDPASIASIRTDELELEFRRQIERVLGVEIWISHLDNHHQWIYFSPRHFRVAAELASEFNVPLRFPFGGLSEDRVSAVANKLGVREQNIRDASSSCKAILDEYQVSYTDSFWIEFTSIYRTEEYFRALLAKLPEGISELCVHPGLDSERRKEELGILLKLASDDAFELNDVELVNYEVITRK